MNRRTLLHGAAAGAATLAWPARFAPATAASPDVKTVLAQVEKRHDEAVKRLQEWIRQPSIAAERRGMSEGCDLMIRLLKDAGFGRAERVPTDGQPGVFATLDAGAPRTLALYFMYDVKQVDPAEWSSPPWEAALVDKPGLGKVVVGRGAVNQKGPEAAFLAALHAYRGANRKPPVNLVFVAEGEEEIEVVEEKIYTIPLRHVWVVTPRGKRAPRAVRDVRDFVARHMKADEVAISNEVNNAIWSRSINKPPRKVTVRAVKDKEGKVIVYPAKTA